MPHREGLASTKRRCVEIRKMDDDPDARQMTKEAFDESHVANDLRFVGDGAELMDYLRRRESYADPAKSPRPKNPKLFPQCLRTLRNPLLRAALAWQSILRRRDQFPQPPELTMRRSLRKDCCHRIRQ